MGVEYRLVNVEKKVKFDLGRGDWHLLFAQGEPKGFKLKEIANKSSELALFIEIILMPREHSSGHCKEVAEAIWEWAGDSTLYFGNDCGGVLDESREEIGLQFPIAGSVYANP